MIGSTRSCSPTSFAVTLLGIIFILLPLETQGFAQSEEDPRALLRALDSLSSERMLADVQTLSGPAFNGRQAGSEDDFRSAAWVSDQFGASRISLAFVPLDRFDIPLGGNPNRRTGFMSKPHRAAIIAPEPTLQISTARIPDNQRPERIFSRCSTHHLRIPVLRSCSSAMGLSIPLRT